MIPIDNDSVPSSLVFCLERRYIRLVDELNGWVQEQPENVDINEIIVMPTAAN